MDARRCALLVSLALTVSAQAGVTNLLTNSDFETVTAGNEPKQTFPPWTEHKSGGDVMNWKAVVATNALSGAYSLQMVNDTKADGRLGYVMQTITPGLTQEWTFSCKFALEDPTILAKRTFGMFLGENSAEGVQMNLRVMDNAGTANVGDVEVYDAGTWRNILTDKVNFSGNIHYAPVVNTLTIKGTFKGAGSSYVVTVNGSSSSTLQYFQVRAPSALARVTFDNQQCEIGKHFVVDDARLEIPVAESKGTVILLR